MTASVTLHGHRSYQTYPKSSMTAGCYKRTINLILVALACSFEALMINGLAFVRRKWKVFSIAEPGTRRPTRNRISFESDRDCLSNLTINKQSGDEGTKWRTSITLLLQ